MIRRAMHLPGVHTVTITATDATGRVARGSCLVDPPAKAASNGSSSNSNSLIQGIKKVFSGEKSSKIKTPTGLSPNEKEYSSSTSSVKLSWDSVKGINNYAVRVDFTGSELRDSRNNCPDSPHYVCINGLTENKISIAVKPSQKYSWWVHAVDSSDNISEPASAWFTVEAKETGSKDSSLGNIFSSAGNSIFVSGLAALLFVLGYLLGKRKNSRRTESFNQFRIPPLVPPSPPSSKQ